MNNKEIDELIRFCENKAEEDLKEEEKFGKIQEILEHYKTCQYNSIFEFLEDKITPIMYHAFLISIGLALGVVCYDALLSFIKGLF